MIAVIFEVRPKPERKKEYLDIAAQLRPILEKIDGFISVERFESLTEPGKILSLSFFRDEGAVQAWCAVNEHRLAQAKGRREIFANYRHGSPSSIVITACVSVHRLRAIAAACMEDRVALCDPV